MSRSVTRGSRTEGAPRGPQDLERRFPPDPQSAREARQFVLDNASSDDEDVNMRLAAVVSELVTNAILHARTPFKVRVSNGVDTIRVDVSDESSEVPAPRPYDIADVTGRGLHIVAGLADRWGISRHSGGKTVWFEIGRELAVS
jgi:anti-sigma regulatory factor (Ser/Thr protein kinase)